jgi:hypothetical protein
MICENSRYDKATNTRTPCLETAVWLSWDSSFRGPLAICQKCADTFKDTIGRLEPMPEDAPISLVDFKDGETVCEHGNRPFDCNICRQDKNC